MELYSLIWIVNLLVMMDCTSSACWRRLGLLSVLLLTTILVGCGSGAYRERMEKHLQDLKAAEAAAPRVTPDMLYQYIPENNLLGDRSFNLRVPRIFSGRNLVFHEQTTGNEHTEGYPADRLWPLGVQVPGYYWTYEGQTPEGATAPWNGDSSSTDKRLWSFSFCFGAEKLSEDEASEAMLTYLEDLNAVLAETTGAEGAEIKEDNIKKVAIKSLDSDETVEWKHVHVEADMPFTSFKGHLESGSSKKAGVLEIYSTYHREHLVILVGNWIKGMEASTLMPDFLPAVAASVKFSTNAESPPQE